MPLLGAHESVAGGLHLAIARIRQVGGEALQIFSRNQRQWRAAPLSQEEIALFAGAWEKAGPLPVISHASYLINLGSGDPAIAEKSVAAFVDELSRCQQLAISQVVIHPGSHGGDGEEAGIARVAAHLDKVFLQAGEGNRVTVLLETTAGQGTSLGSRFEELAAIRELNRFPGRIAFCFDTCHAFAAGYDLSSRAGYGQVMDHWERVIGCSLIRAFHLNDSKKELGSRVDRHEHIGRGHIGLDGFAALLNDSRFAVLPMLLETPKGDDLAEDRENLAVLRSLLL